MKGKRFRIPSLALAGFMAHDVGRAAVPTDAPDVDELRQSAEPSLFDVLRLDHAFTMAQHRSHSSHGSHRSSSGGGGHSSHASHRSSTTGGRPAPAPRVYSPPATRNQDSTPPSTVLPSSPATAPKVLPGDTAKFKDIVRQVQIGLMTRGYYSGAIDGLVGPETRASLIRFQTDYKLSVTGTVTPEVLDAFGVAAR